jgi:molybdopterin-guanine dinucleotide biosynthesis protein A
MPSAAILAGGHARRFGGRDKSALVVAGRTILERQVATLAALSDDVMIVAAPGRRAPSAPGARAVTDRVSGKGPLGGLDAALAAARHSELVLVACDMPFLRVDFLKYLVSLAPYADAVVPRTERGYHPLCAVYTRACAPAVERAVAAGRLRMIDMLNELVVRDVAADEIERFGPRAGLLANVNSPSEFEELEALPGHKP